MKPHEFEMLVKFSMYLWLEIIKMSEDLVTERKPAKKSKIRRLILEPSVITDEFLRAKTLYGATYIAEVDAKEKLPGIMTDNREFQELLGVLTDFTTSLHSAMVFYVFLLEAIMAIQTQTQEDALEHLKAHIGSFINSYSLSADLFKDVEKKFKIYEKFRKKNKFDELGFDF